MSTKFENTEVMSVLSRSGVGVSRDVIIGVKKC